MKRYLAAAGIAAIVAGGVACGSDGQMTRSERVLACRDALDAQIAAGSTSPNDPKVCHPLPDNLQMRLDLQALKRAVRG